MSNRFVEQNCSKNHWNAPQIFLVLRPAFSLQGLGRRGWRWSLGSNWELKIDLEIFFEGFEEFLLELMRKNIDRRICCCEGHEKRVPTDRSCCGISWIWVWRQTYWSYECMSQSLGSKFRHLMLVFMPRTILSMRAGLASAWAIKWEKAQKSWQV